MPLPEKLRSYLFWGLNALLGVIFLMTLSGADRFSWAASAFIVLAAITSVMALNRQLPCQNILTAAAITAAIGGLAHGFTARSSIPFGPVVFSSEAGAELFGTLPWLIPVIWIVAVFTARGVARLMLRPWRKTRTYGWWLIALTALLVVALDLALEPFAWHVKHFWLWQPTKLTWNWHGTSLLNFFGWGCVTLLILAFITPSLIRKQPGSSGGPDYHPLFVWLGLLTMFAVGCAGEGLWWAVGTDAVIAVITTIFAVRGARW